MAAPEETDFVGNDEIVFRRVREGTEPGHYDPNSEKPVAWVVFRPNKHDTTGISVWRARHRSAEQVARWRPQPNRRYWVLALRVGALREIGVEVVATPSEGGVGHASLTTLNAQAYHGEEKDRIHELAEFIASTLVDSVQGPFGPFEPATP
ncbi:hypothetical protein RAS1_11470 [Phycisphaerae bacterium RAS1]|nr:hypothetical protein RAS1_11470 [Phycisphaerae bacterium RAS1]